MAHALKRISYATCDPEFCQFSFLAREPKGHTASQYCHAFITKTADEVMFVFLLKNNLSLNGTEAINNLMTLHILCRRTEVIKLFNFN